MSYLRLNLQWIMLTSGSNIYVCQTNKHIGLFVKPSCYKCDIDVLFVNSYNNPYLVKMSH